MKHLVAQATCAWVPRVSRGGHKRLRSGAVASSRSARATGTCRPLPPPKLGMMILVCSHSDNCCLALSTALSRLCMSPTLAQLHKQEYNCYVMPDRAFRACEKTKCRAMAVHSSSENQLLMNAARAFVGVQQHERVLILAWPALQKRLESRVGMLTQQNLPGLAATPTASRPCPSHRRQAWHRLLLLTPPGSLRQHASRSAASCTRHRTAHSTCDSEPQFPLPSWLSADRTPLVQSNGREGQHYYDYLIIIVSTAKVMQDCRLSLPSKHSTRLTS